MLINFFFTLRAAKLKVSVKEYLVLLEAIQVGVIDNTVDEFYYLARTSLVKDEAHFDKFDRAFAAYFKGVELLTDFTQDVPLDWLQKKLELELSAEDKALIEKMGWDELMETLKKRFEEQKERHEGGSKMIGTGGTSPFGAYGYNPQGRQPHRKRRAFSGNAFHGDVAVEHPSQPAFAAVLRMVSSRSSSSAEPSRANRRRRRSATLMLRVPSSSVSS